MGVARWSRLCELDQIPAVAKGIAPDGDDAIGFVAGGLFELDAMGCHAGVISGKIIGFQKQPDAARALCPNGGLLIRAFGAGKDQASAAAGRFHCDPALVTQIKVGGQTKAKGGDEEGDGAVIVRDNQRHA